MLLHTAVKWMLGQTQWSVSDAEEAAEAAGTNEG